MSWERDWPAAMLVAAAALMIAPLWCVQSPAMPDYPAHLASFYLIGGGANDPLLAHFYRIQWLFAPNLASEIVVPVLAPALGLAGAAKLFLSLALALWVLGPGMVHRALYGRSGIGPLFGALFAYNGNFFWGFCNYYFAAGLSFVLFALWIWTAGRAHWARLTNFAVAVTLLYFCHIFAAATLGLMIGGYELSKGLCGHETLKMLARRAGGVFFVFLPAAFAFLFLATHGHGDNDLAFNLADTMLDRFESLTLHHFDAPAYVLPILLFAGLAGALSLGRAWLHRDMWLVLALLLVAALLAPEWAMGGWAVHLRLPACFAILLFAATAFKVERRTAGFAILALVAFTAAGVAANWRGYDRQYREFRAALGALPRGQKLLTVLDGDSIGWDSDQPYWHMAEFAVIDRSDMTGLLFATHGQHVVQLKPPMDRFAAQTAQQGSPPDLDELDDLANGIVDGDSDIRDIFPYLMHFQCHYDEAVVIHPHGVRETAPDMLALRHRGSFFSLYDIRRDGRCAGR